MDLVVTTIVLLITATSSASSSLPLLVNTTHGLIRGHINEVGIREWKGIPYAAPPVGSLRWKYPTAPSDIPPNQVYEANFDAPGIQKRILNIYKIVFSYTCND